MMTAQQSAAFYTVVPASRRPTRLTIPFLSAEIHEHERTSLNCSRARARANARTQSLPAFGYTCMVFVSFVGGYKFS
jgi:hypothetical protein